MSVALSRPLDSAEGVIEVKTTRGKLLQALGTKSETAKAKAQVWKYLEEIKEGNIHLTSPRHLFSASLLSSIELRIKIGSPSVIIARVPKEVFALLCDEVVVIPLQQKRALGKDAVTLWLFDFLSSQSNDKSRMIPWPIEELYKLCGCRSTLRSFRAAVKKAGVRLSDGPSSLLVEWHIDKHDRLVYEKRKTTVVLLPAPAKKVEQIRNFREDQVAAAIRQREHAYMG